MEEERKIIEDARTRIYESIDTLIASEPDANKQRIFWDFLLLSFKYVRTLAPGAYNDNTFSKLLEFIGMMDNNQKVIAKQLIPYMSQLHPQYDFLIIENLL